MVAFAFDGALVRAYLWRMMKALRLLSCAVGMVMSAAFAHAQMPGKGLTGPPGPNAAPATAEQIEKMLSDMHKKLVEAPDARSAAKVAAGIERLWGHAGSDTSMVLMQRASTALAKGKKELAVKFLTVAVELQPDYAEAWNRRAALFYDMDQVDRAVGDLRRALALNPKHFRALEGLANIFREQGQDKAALAAINSLIEVYPLAPGVKQLHEELVRDVEGQEI